ncbi:hypothetical protein LQ236_001591 [Nitrospina gracilis]|uniref:hypothetical protein n=1 Tax=Nitrospina TaxID=35800 RepID=UPI001181DE60|nr:MULTISPECIES: hypothetical protein [Nitrospina]MCF8723571.1 hypothetical protein [Nitrospina sp. Nb-3]
MNRYPGYNFLTILLATFNLFHMGVVLASLVTGLMSGILWAAGTQMWALVFLIIATCGLSHQTFSRLVHLCSIRGLRRKGDVLQVKNPRTGEWLNWDRVLSFEKANFPSSGVRRSYANYPGIRFALKRDPGSAEESLLVAEDRFGWGMEPVRDRVFEDLLKKYPQNAVDV